MFKGLQKIWDRVASRKGASRSSSGEGMEEVGPTLPMTPDVVKLTLGIQIANLTREEIVALEYAASTISFDFGTTCEEEVDDLLNRRDLGDIQLELSGLQSLLTRVKEAGIDYNNQTVSKILLTLAHRERLLEGALKKREVDVMQSWSLADLQRMGEEENR